MIANQSNARGILAAVSNAGSEVAGSGGVQSVDRALNALQILARRGEAGVTELAAEICVHKSTASRLLGALENHELVEQARERGKYRLGLGVLRLANAVPGQLDITQQGREICERLAKQVGETVNIAVLRSHYAVNVNQARGSSVVGAQNWVGALTPLHATSSGKILLAYMSPDARCELLQASGLKRFTDRTITSIDEVETELSAVARNGYALAVEEFEEGLNAVAAPVRDHSGAVIAALSASGPVYRLTQERAHEIAPAVSVAAAEVSQRMGYQG